LSPACPLDCDRCPAVRRCGKVRNFCLLHDTGGGCQGCGGHPLLSMDVRRDVMQHLGGLDFEWPRPIRHSRLPELPVHLPVLVQAYADPLDVPWVALHAGRVFGVTGRRLTPKHRRPLREVYRLAPTTRLALQFYVEDRVLEGLWANWRRVIREIAELHFDLVLTPSYSVWRNAPRYEQLVQERRAFVAYHQLVEAGLPAVPDIGFSFFEPDGRLWAEWVNSQPDLQAVSIFCGGKKIHAERRAHRETVEDIALFHEQVRPEVTFILGGIHAPRRLLDYRRAAPGRRLVICNGMAYSLAQRRRLLDRAGASMVARSARECFLLNSAFNDRVYAHVLGEETTDAIQVR
jgi:Domain of unknown function (DUF4417)